MMDVLSQHRIQAETLLSAERRGNTVRMTLGDGSGGAFALEVCVLRQDILRLRLSKGAFVPPAYDFVRPDYFTETDEAAYAETPEGFTLSTPALSLRVTRHPFGLSLLSAAGETLYEEQLDDLNPVGAGVRGIPAMGCTLDENGETLGMNLCARLRQDEHIFGLGERFGELDLRGQSVCMWNQDTLGCRDGQAYKNIPFYYSSAGYGLFVNSHRDTTFHVGSLSVASLCVQTPGDSVEAYLLVGAPRDVIGAFTGMTGPAALPPAWSFGLWYSNGFQDAAAEGLLRDARAFRERSLPCDVMHLDCYWMRDDMWCDFVWDETRFPDPAGMIRALKERHYHVCVWINPYVTNQTDMFAEGRQKGYFVKTTAGEVYLDDLWHGLLSPCALLDVTHPEAVAWFEEKLRGLLAVGLDALKTDFGEEIPPDGLFYNGKTGQEMRNVYASLYNEIVYRVIGEQPSPSLVWARSGTAGMQRFPVCWSGDPRSSYEGMAATLRGGLSVGVSGVPFWSHDIGGFYGPIGDEIYVRWAQFGLLSSHSRLHGTSPRSPWSFSERACRIVEETIRLRYRLMPYILQSAAACAAEGLPMVRPLWLLCPEDPVTWQIQDEYFFGEDILVAPMFGGDGVSRRLYLPAGRWKYWFTSETYDGGRYIILRCSLEEFPLFVREGTVLPTDESGRQWIEG